MAFFCVMKQVYILQSQSNKRYYTGVSHNPDLRLIYHNNGMNKSTKNKGPWIIIWTSNFIEQSEALRLEKKIKKRGAARFLNDLE